VEQKRSFCAAPAVDPSGVNSAARIAHIANLIRMVDAFLVGFSLRA
jgi:hypothetical protein